MSYSFEDIDKRLTELNQKIERHRERASNKKIGFNAKCKVCTSPHIDKIEELREEGHTLEEIKEELNLDLSIMSLSRHFQNHYPKNQRYKLKQQIELLENIQEAYSKYPYLENYFKDRPLEYLERFNNKDGFCTDGFCLCTMLKAGTVRDCYSNVNDQARTMLEDIQKVKDGYYYSTRDDKIKEIQITSLLFQNQCLKCKMDINSERLDLLERIITYNFLNIPQDDKETYFKLLGFYGSKSEFVKSLGEVKGDTPAK